MGSTPAAGSKRRPSSAALRVSDLLGTKQFLTYVTSGPFRYAVAEALALPDPYYATFRDDLQTKRDLLADGLRDAGFAVYKPQSTYFATTGITPSPRTRAP